MQNQTRQIPALIHQASFQLVFLNTYTILRVVFDSNLAIFNLNQK